jgi:hypothetical protein
MPKLKSSQPLAMRFSRDCINVLDDISVEFGNLPRRSAIELLARFACRVRDASGSTYSDLLLKDALPSPEDENGV